MRATAACLLAAVLPLSPVLGQESSSRPAVLPLAGAAEDAAIEAATARIATASGDAGRDAAALAAVERLAAGLAGGRFSRLEIDQLVAQMAADAAVERVRYRLLPAGNTSVTIQFDVDVAGAAAVKPAPVARFPDLVKNDRTQVAAIIGGGIGTYTDGNPWFGKPVEFNASSPVAGNPPGRQPLWTEGYLEVGAGFATQLGESQFYLFGAATGMLTWSLGQDVFRDDSRAYFDAEKLYAGLLYVDRGNRNRAKLQLGQQTYTLNDGFLVNMVKASSNAGARGATYLGPRLTSDFSVLADARIGKLSVSAFYIDPNEIEFLESNSRFLGGNIAYAISDDVSVDASLIGVPNSKSTFSTPQGPKLRRQGNLTVAGHLKVKNLVTDGLFTEAELAHQWHPDQDWSAWAGYGSLGYIARNLAWKPSLSYRYAVFSGDDPATSRFERFDAPLSTGLGIWLQGISFGKVTTNSNLVTHRVQLNVAPARPVNITFDFHKLRADYRNNLGANPLLSQLSSTDIGEEYSLSLRWSLTRKIFLQSVLSAAMPGRALQDIGADKTWSTFQLSLYWSL
jgi:hypothetical protein